MPRTKQFSYEVELGWQGGRTSILSAGDREAILSAPPDDFPGGDPSRWSPEQLFLASLASCTMISFLAHADHRDLEVRGYACAIGGTVMRRLTDGRYAFVHVHQRPRVIVAAGGGDIARELIGKAERDCFISASTTAEIQNDWDITEAES